MIEKWPEMAETEWDDENVAVDGTNPISTVGIGGWGGNNRPHAFVDSAACARCDKWASSAWVGRQTVSEGPWDNQVTRGISMEISFACPDHEEEVSRDLCTRWGGSSNSVKGLLELAEMVEARHRDVGA